MTVSITKMDFFGVLMVTCETFLCLERGALGASVSLWRWANVCVKKSKTLIAEVVSKFGVIFSRARRISRGAVYGVLSLVSLRVRTMCRA